MNSYVCLICLVLAAVLCFSLGACSGTVEGGNESGSLSSEEALPDGGSAADSVTSGTGTQTSSGSGTNTGKEDPSVGYNYDSAVTKAAKQAKVIYRVDEPKTFSEKLSLASLQGLVANSSDEQILISVGGGYSKYIGQITGEWGCKVRESVSSKPAAFASLVEYYRKSVDGYILCSDRTDSESGSVAVSLAGLLNAVIVTPQNKKVCDDLGMKCLLDVTDKDDAWLRSSKYWSKLSREVAVEQPLSMAPKLVDYAVMSKAYFSFYNGHDASAHQKKYGFLDDGATVFGYNNTLGEYDTVKSFGSENLQMIPADHAYNLSTLSGFKASEFSQKTARTEVAKGKKAHTVCIVMSDGDNVQWVLNDFSESKWFANSNRGKFKMGWGLPATAVDLIAPMNSYLYGAMSDKDEFIMQLSGLGYTFPSKWSAAERDKMAAKLSEYMERSDLRFAEILDDGGMKESVVSSFTKQKGIDGLFYIDYADYAGMKGKLLWSNDKPVVSARYKLWADMPGSSPEDISKAVNAASTDPADADSYSFIIVHAWSGLNDGKLAPNGNTMDAVAKLVSSFDSDVQVVTPSEFMDLIITNKAK